MISFIVPAYNEARLLGRTLAALADAARTNSLEHEVIVADDFSTDATASVALEHGARVVAVEARQIAATRNAGARAAKGEWLIFVDADTLVSADVLRGAVEALGSGAVGGGSTLRIDGAIPFHMLPITVGVPWFMRVAGLAAGCFLFCTRTAFEAAGGFDERFFAGEEIVLSRALKRQGRFVILRTPVVTSGRKLRSHSWTEVVWLLAAAIRHGPKAVQTRRGLGLWYGDRKDDE